MFNFSTIGIIECNFVEKFGIPRQPGLSPSSDAQIKMPKTRFNQEAIQDLEGCSHIWVIFVFDKLKKIPDKPKIRPPRLGGNKYVGVFSSRSPYRPNPIGLSLVEFKGITKTCDHIYILISNHDLMNETPVLDIKPYSEFDTPEQATFNWQNEAWDNLKVTFSETANNFLGRKPHLKEQIKELLSNDPRPAYMKKKTRSEPHGLTIGNYNIKFLIEEHSCCVLSVAPVNKFT